MGVPAGEEDREGVPDKYKGLSVPRHRVVIGRSFAIGKYAVTRGEFSAFVADTAYHTTDKCWVYVDTGQRHEWQERSGYSWRNPGFSQTDRGPVVCVTWDDAKAYVAWLSRKTGNTYRLPSEAEWEYAARAGSQTARFWGDAREQMCVYANTKDLTFASTFNLVRESVSPCSDGYAFTSPVGEFRANSFGLYDMLGNAWQWVEDCWNEDYQGAPTDGSSWLAGACDKRVMRGGSWGVDPWVVRTGYRFRGAAATSQGAGLGFRVARNQ